MPTLHRFLITLALGVLLLQAGCDGTAVAAPVETLPPTRTPPPTATATPPPTPTLTPTPSRTPPPSPSPTPTWTVQGPGHVVVPILLYHRIAVSSTGSPYYVSPERFEEQVRTLYEWGYTSIPISLLVEAITRGVPLPPRPVVFTFDDGDITVYTHAFPIMQKYGFTGVIYLVYNYLNADGYMNTAQVRELADAGWEVGSHSMTHSDLSKKSGADLRWEIAWSRRNLEEALGVPVRTFAYPFGRIGGETVSQVKAAYYIAAVGLGTTADQWPSNLYYLQRRDMYDYYDRELMAKVLPWSASLEPAGTPIP